MDKNRTRKLHPLHTPEWLADIVLNTGCYPDTTRRTGRTTAAALRTIATAIENPDTAIKYEDHQGTVEASYHMANVMSHICEALKLEHMHVRPKQQTITFERLVMPKPDYTFTIPPKRG